MAHVCSRRRPIAAGSFVAAALLLAAQTALASTHTWNGGNTFGPTSMSNGLNWSGGVPVSGSANLALVFPVGGVNNPNQNIANPLVLQSMQVPGGYTFGGSAYHFSNLGASPSLTVGGFANFNTGVAFNATTALTVNGTMNVNGQMSGAGNINLTGGGTLNIQSGAINNNTGTLFVTGTQVNMSASQAIGGDLNATGTTISLNLPMQFAATSDVVLDSTTLQINGNQQVRDLRVDNNAQVNVTSTDTLYVTGIISNLAGAGSIGSSLSSIVDFGLAARTIDVQSTGVGSGLTMNSLITNGTFVKTGAGMLTLFNTGNFYSGQNVISAGTVRASPGSVGSSLLNNGVLELAGGGAFNSNVVSGTGQVVVMSFVQFNAAQSYTGGTDVRFGSLVFGDSSTFNGDFTSTLGSGTMVFNQSTNGTYAGTLSGGLQVNKQSAGTLTLSGANTYTGTTTLSDGGLALASDSALGAGPLVISASSPVSLSAIGTRSIANVLQFASDFSVVGAGNVTFTNTALKNLNSQLTHNSTGSTTFDGKFTVSNSGSIVVNSGSLVLGDPASVGGFNVIGGGKVTVNGGSLTVRSLNFTQLNDVTLAGGTLNAPNGYAIPLGAALQGSGAVAGRVASANGSTVLASGNLTVGDASHVAGVNLDGELYTRQFTVQLDDANQAVLGSVTSLGNGPGSPGTLAAPNGVVLNFGRNLVGFGNLTSNNNLADAVIVNGDVQGNSPSDAINFTGYVKGVGTFNNVTFGGTFAPGLSPALVTVGTIGFGPTNNLEMEIGGLLRGSQYDALDITGTLTLNGTLQVQLINGFNPSLGNTFNLFDGTTAGTFSAFNFPPLTAGLIWDTSDLYTQGTLNVVQVPEPAGAMAMLLGAGTAVLARRRRRA